MTIATARPTLDHPDVTQAKLISRACDDAEGCEMIHASIPSRQDSEVRYLVQGHTHARDASCSCLRFLRWRRCCHAAAFILIIEELEKQHYATPEHTTERLFELARYYDSIADILSPDQRLRYHGVKAALLSRGIRYEATRTLAEQLRVAERAAAAKAELFG